MTKPMIRIHNLETGETIDREMTNSEFADYEASEALEMARQAEVEAKAEAKVAAQSKLAALGLTVEDLTALGL